MAKVTARKVALDALLEVEKMNGYSNRVLNRMLGDAGLEAAERRLTTRLLYGVLENKNLLDHIIRQYINFRINKLDPAIRNILRMGIYQIVFMENIPDSAAVNEGVKLAKQYKNRYSGFVNGVLRTFLRKDKAYTLPDKEKDLLNHLTVVYSHPDWIVRRWLKRFGAEFTEDLLKSNNEIPELIGRVNVMQATRDAVLKSLEFDGFLVEPASLPDAFKVKTENAGSLAESQVFKNGQVTIQDIAAQAVGYIAGPRPGQFVIDMCAAPGGKSTHLASIMNDEGTVLSWDIYDHKISKIEENAQRMNLKSIKASLKDALELDESLIEKADIVLLDAPCSGLGIIRRKPEIKFNKIEEDIYELAEIQSDMLDMASKYIKPGGHLVYSTCTIEPEENELQIKRFIERHPDFKVENIDLDILPELWTHDTKGYMTLYPNIHGTDGFFICKLVKNN
ncbi:16S rRNA (cytosine(967)-C(5))-methyltransferase RsmB [Fusibacter sp. JL216-2]|uniref:16S rRNA (cytosine(967)-C(5))-methyltransferase RsmB n=1 Tax=Fusibacter sp. JL216-2 TaxID=3071453 RepID=UPI003D336846